MFQGRIHVEDMSQYFGEHYASAIIGAPPGYVGFQTKTAMMRFIDDNPTGVILLNEIEKSSTRVKTVMMELFDTGYLRDAGGNEHDARNILFIMTSNLGFSSQGGEKRIGGFSYEDKIKPTGEKDHRKEISGTGFFLPEELNRITYVVKFSELGSGDIDNIAKRHLSEMLDTIPTVKDREPSREMVDKAMARYREGGLRSMLSYINTVLRAEIWEQENGDELH